MVLDGMLTFMNTPNLAHEGNPIVSVFGFGWGALITANIIVYTTIFALSFYSIVKYKTVVVPAKSTREYISQMLFNRPDKFSWVFWRRPKRLSPIIALLGFCMVWSHMIGRTIVVAEWAAITLGLNTKIFDATKQIAPFHRPDVIIVVVSCLFLIVIWFFKEHKKSEKVIASNPELGKAVAEPIDA